MPQLDSLTYFTQFFWFIISFILLYILIENVVLPHISMILKIRNAMKSKKNEITEKKNNAVEILTSSNLNSIEKFSNEFNLNNKEWSFNAFDTIRQDQLNELNKIYTENIGVILLKRKINK